MKSALESPRWEGGALGGDEIKASLGPAGVKVRRSGAGEWRGDHRLSLCVRLWPREAYAGGAGVEVCAAAHREGVAEHM